MQTSPVSFPSAGPRPVRLEGVLHQAAGEGQLPAAVICHPHPLGGGSMHNGVVVAIARALASGGVIALRFNFRGVGASEGTFDNGVGERDDLAGALDWLLAQPSVDPRQVSVVGYSFGACVGLVCAQSDARVSAYAGVGLSMAFCDSGDLQSFIKDGEDASFAGHRSLACPKLFVTGEHDHLAPPDQLLGLVERLPEPKSVQLVPGVDHFWWGAEREAAKRVAGFLTGLWANR
ncbi:MAG: alpha/beta hydrolase [Anaerolineae bacterium]